MTSEWGVYVHIPFCQARCTYCDFNTVTGMTVDDHRRYTAALLKEWDREVAPDGALVSIYFGGGTPSLLDPILIGRVIQRVLARVSCDAAEITVETNPATVTEQRLAALRKSGVNRLSIGAQALQNHHLSALNRTHDVDAINKTVEMARWAGFDNISLDAIYGLPGQTMAEWQATIEGLLALDPEHLSLYSLIVEEGTPLKRAVERGLARLPEPDRVADMADWAEERLTRAELFPYEISNYARPGRESRHNRLYWQMEPYLALGAGAHAYRPGRRWWNVRGVRRYMETVEGGRDPMDSEEFLTKEEEMREFLWLGFRQRIGVDVGRFQQRFSLDPRQAFHSTLGDLHIKGLMIASADHLVLTRRGRDMANVVARALVDADVDVSIHSPRAAADGASF